MVVIHTATYLLSLSAAAVIATANPHGKSLPTVVLDNATVIGQPNGTTIKYLGLPFAQPPTGNLRLRLPQPVLPYNGTTNAPVLENQCIQQTFPDVTLPSDVPAAAGQYLAAFLQAADVPQSEDCLNLNVIVPANATTQLRLPVAVWIYGGGFQIGSNALEHGENVVARSIELGYPIVYVGINYRLSAFGFLGGKEVKEAGVGNLGLQDQREAFRWVQKYISAFGGDPTKVMIWGESAGSISVALHMLHNGGNTDGLFRAGFMESGTVLPSGYVDNEYLQNTYDGIVQDAGCSGSNDTLQCLREVEKVLKAAMDKTPTFVGYQQVNTPYFPRADGVFVAQPSEQQLLAGAVAQIPLVAGNDQDEGTAFAFPTLNITTDDEFLEYINSNFYSNTPRDEVGKILELYPSDPADGAPYNTGDSFAYSPQYKRMAAFQGDFIEIAPRRLFTQYLAEKQPVHSYLSNFHKVEGIGAAHGTELADIFGGGPMQDYLIRFAATLNPNGNGAFTWPRYTNSSPALLTFNDAVPQLNITLDTFRAVQMEYLNKLSLADPI
ncbi:carotenoid ester lipase [Dichomitus squalens LYAD-421 SS1]|uniref:Carboxylic ester hydrolase n=1 Tax=Dichomitus squalens (strain LYAD-421) TaxID=732165 RepID=R7SLN3_DICSQ|nr:carotenoid ester lipase [Dichomitus squalens LYAD-421 SS1]EJF57054.1 carotenoid ester lipase [Dichomitus squalens LYAD-421 SS1]